MESSVVLFDFYGLPGCGKSVCSHEVELLLIKNGFVVDAPTYKMDHIHNKLFRYFLKSIYAFLFSVNNKTVSNRINQLVVECCGCEKSMIRRLRRNILYKFYYLYSASAGFVLMDEGLLQSSISLSVGRNINAKDVYMRLSEFLPLNIVSVPILVNCEINTSLVNMDNRKEHDSRIEKISDLGKKIESMNLYKKKIEDLSSFGTVMINNNNTLSPSKVAEMLLAQLKKRGII